MDYQPEMIRFGINTALHAERQKYLGVSPYVRAKEHQVHSHGYKPKIINILITPITFDIHQVCKGCLYPETSEKGFRSEMVLILTLADYNHVRGMYIKGVSTSKVAEITLRLY